ncbi:hypothetical protein PHBOTO_001795 [Pseudozyma hubeiensis]|nr:hypothetical protein PHBOTO_001795 [Pseudozyma hubeiensis]
MTHRWAVAWGKVEYIRYSPLHNTAADSDSTIICTVVKDALVTVTTYTVWSSCSARCFVSDCTVLGNHHVSPESHHRCQ